MFSDIKRLLEPLRAGELERAWATQTISWGQQKDLLNISRNLQRLTRRIPDMWGDLEPAVQRYLLDLANDFSEFAGVGATYFAHGVLTAQQQPIPHATSLALGRLIGVNASKYARPAYTPGQPLGSHAVLSVFIAASAAFAQATFTAADADA